jgi:cob(I)alamin adenosyltransferase
MNQGLVYVFTGEGKGKTSAAIGVAVRAVGVGMTVAWVAWYKQASWKLSETKLLQKLGVDVYLLGKGFHILAKRAKVGDKVMVVDTATETEHRKAAELALRQAEELAGKVDVLILDEVNNAVKDKLISINDLLELIAHRGKTNLVLTGRGAAESVIKQADLVTEMKKIKHPYDQGKLAVKGLDF